MHGIMNKTAGTFMDFFVDKDRINPLINLPTGVIGILLAGMIAWAIYRKGIPIASTRSVEKPMAK